MDRPGRVPVEQAYIAHLWAYGKVVGRGSARGGLPGARFLLALPAEGGEGAFLPLPAKHRGLALRSFLGRPVHAHFWPRTDGEGLLREAALVHIFPLEDPPPGLSRPTFLVRGRLLGVERDIREKGVLQPLLVRPLGDGRYAIVAGERRYRAARMAGLSEVPVRVVELSEKEARLFALVENLQREDLNPYEETVGVLALLSEDLGKPVEEVVGLLRRMRKEKRGEAGHNVMASPEAQRVEEVFQALGRMTWESFVQNRLPLLNLPEDLKAALEEGAIPYTAALELKKVKDEALRKALLEEVKAGLSLRELKARVREVLVARKPALEKAPAAWYGDVIDALKKTDFSALPTEKRARVEALLAELKELLG